MVVLVVVVGSRELLFSKSFPSFPPRLDQGHRPAGVLDSGQGLHALHRLQDGVHREAAHPPLSRLWPGRLRRLLAAAQVRPQSRLGDAGARLRGVRQQEDGHPLKSGKKGGWGEREGRKQNLLKTKKDNPIISSSSSSSLHHHLHHHPNLCCSRLLYHITLSLPPFSSSHVSTPSHHTTPLLHLQPPPPPSTTTPNDTFPSFFFYFFRSFPSPLSLFSFPPLLHHLCSSDFSVSFPFSLSLDIFFSLCFHCQWQ